jgi:hypothetical protein
MPAENNTFGGAISAQPKCSHPPAIATNKLQKTSHTNCISVYGSRRAGTKRDFLPKQIEAASSSDLNIIRGQRTPLSIAHEFQECVWR